MQILFILFPEGISTKVHSKFTVNGNRTADIITATNLNNGKRSHQHKKFTSESIVNAGSKISSI